MSASTPFSRSITSARDPTDPPQADRSAAICIATSRPRAVEFLRVASRFDRDQHADLAETLGDRIVHVGADHTLADRERRSTTQRHVLADGRDRGGDRLLHGLVADLGGLDSLGVAAVGQRGVGDQLDQALEVIVARDEVGFRIDLDDRALAGQRSKCRSSLRPRRGRPFWRPSTGPSCAASQSPLRCHPWSRSAPTCNPSCPRRSVRADPSRALR